MRERAPLRYNGDMRRLSAALALGSAAFAFTALLHWAGLLERLESITLDARYASGIGRKAPGAGIVIAWIDQGSIDHVRRSGTPFP